MEAEFVDCKATTGLFQAANKYELLHDRIDIRGVNKITQKEYQVGGSTALLDAVGNTIQKVANAQMNTSDEYRAENVMFVIITDGMENSSRGYSPEQIRHMIKQQKEQYGWEFIFLGANIDAVETAESFGISPDRAQDFHADSEGVNLNFMVINDVVTTYRKSAAVPKDWNVKIREDFKKRK